MRHKFLILVHLGFFLLLAGRIAPLFAGEKAEEKVGPQGFVRSFLPLP